MTTEAAGRAVVRERSTGLCEAAIDADCQQVATDVHHRRNRSQGGTWDPANLLHICRACHGWIGGEPAAASRLGLTLRHGDAPSSPVLIAGPRWVLLSPDGSYADVAASLAEADAAGVEL